MNSDYHRDAGRLGFTGREADGELVLEAVSENDERADSPRNARRKRRIDATVFTHQRHSSPQAVRIDYLDSQVPSAAY
jgi:hypothetical protein